MNHLLIKVSTAQATRRWSFVTRTSREILTQRSVFKDFSSRHSDMITSLALSMKTSFHADVSLRNWFSC